jgi:hypothetical protein
MRVEVLYSERCPGYERLLPMIRRHAALVGAELAIRRVDTEQEAEAVRFLGSPTVRVDGADVEPGADAREDFGLKCRLYRTSAGMSGVPPASLLEEAFAQRQCEVDELSRQG